MKKTFQVLKNIYQWFFHNNFKKESAMCTLQNKAKKCICHRPFKSFHFFFLFRFEEKSCLSSESRIWRHSTSFPCWRIIWKKLQIGRLKPTLKFSRIKNNNYIHLLYYPVIQERSHVCISIRSHDIVAAHK